MLYVEFLRARNVLRVFGIVLLVPIVVALCFRPFVHPEASMDWMRRSAGLSDATLQSQRTLPDGTRESIYVARSSGNRAVVDDRGYYGGTITTWIRTAGSISVKTSLGATAGPSSRRSSASLSVTDASPPFVSVSSRREGKFQVVTFATDRKTDAVPLISLGIAAGLIIASILGCAFLSQNDGHLELAFMRPVSRESSAVAIIGVDLAAILVSQVATVLTAIACLSIFTYPNLLWSVASWQEASRIILLSFAWYGLMLAASASLRRNYGAIVGPGWAVLLTLPGIVALLLAQPGALHAIGVALHAVALLDPLLYGQFSDSDVGIVGSTASSVAWLAGLTLLYLTAAVLQWRRVEA